MDRIISLLAALVGLIALAGAVLVHTNGDMQRAQMAAEIASLKASIGSGGAVSMPSAQLPAGQALGHDDGTAEALLALQSRIVVLEQKSKTQETQVAAAEAAAPAPLTAPSSAAPTPSAASTPSAAPSSSADPSSAASSGPAPANESSLPPLAVPASSAAADDASAQVAEAEAADAPVAEPSQNPTAAAIVADGPTKDCIPLGTRFMAQAGDSFPICKTKAVVKVASVSDGTVILNGAGPVDAGGFGSLTTKGCTVMVFSADSSGFAEMRVTCQ